MKALTDPLGGGIQSGHGSFRFERVTGWACLLALSVGMRGVVVTFSPVSVLRWPLGKERLLRHDHECVSQGKCDGLDT
jgi:hypothetical protein